MARLNSEEHKKFDIGAKIVKGSLIAATFVGSLLLGKAALDGDKSKNENSDNTSDIQE